MLRLIYPSDILALDQVDEVYALEFDIAQKMGFEVSLFSFEDFQRGQFKPRPALHAGEQALFRCWMMTPIDYSRLYSSAFTLGVAPITSPSDYATCHHLPNWYHHLKQETAETKFYSESDDLTTDLQAEGWTGCFLKDYVKSLSTDGGSVIRNLSDIPAVVEKMRKYRGFIEGGLCARRLEAYQENTERRYFIWQGTPYSSDPQEEVPKIVWIAADKIKSPFFTVDVARRTDGLLRIIELGDGQVSDRKHWPVEAFLSMLNS